MPSSKELPKSQSWFCLISFGKFGLVAMLCCFGYVIYNANEKLMSGTVGTAFSMVDVKMVQECVVQGDRSTCSKPPVNIDLKVAL